MATTGAYKCDGPDCDQLVTLEPRKRTPAKWARVIVHVPDEIEPRSGFFHDRDCIDAFLDEHLGYSPSRAVAPDYDPGV